MLEGEVSYVLPRYNNEEYHVIHDEEHFGHEDFFRIAKMDDAQLQAMM